MTVVTDHERRFVDDAKARHLNASERSMVLAAFDRYLETIPQSKRSRRPVYYDVKDVVASTGFGIGSAGLPAYNVLIEGFNQALENDIVLSMKQGNQPAASRVVKDKRIRDFFEHDGHRTVVSQRALQAHTDQFLGWTTIDDTGFVVAELSPYEADLDWSDITEPDEMAPLLEDLGRATAKVHCASDEDSDEELVEFQTEEAILDAIGDRGAGVRRGHRRVRHGLRRDRPPRPCPVRRCVPCRGDRRLVRHLREALTDRMHARAPTAARGRGSSWSRQETRTFSAWGPLGPCARSNSTFWFSSSDL